jgi:putative transposase
MKRSGDGAANSVPAFAKRLRRKKPSRGDIWHLDEVVISIGGRKHWLWRAVDQSGYVLDEIVQTRRDTKAAKRLLIRLLERFKAFRNLNEIPKSAGL